MLNCLCNKFVLLVFVVCLAVGQAPSSFQKERTILVKYTQTYFNINAEKGNNTFILLSSRACIGCRKTIIHKYSKYQHYNNLYLILNKEDAAYISAGTKLDRVLIDTVGKLNRLNLGLSESTIMHLKNDGTTIIKRFNPFNLDSLELFLKGVIPMH